MHRRAQGSSLEVSDRATTPQVNPRPGETIAAISTAPGEGAIALVRLSGENAIAVADRIFRGKQKPSSFVSHTQHVGEIVDEHDRLIDEVMISVHRAPASYTGEDLVEISCHGGMLVTARVLETCLAAGARAAAAGEFTRRAFLNGKMDLTQAEAVIDLIRARTDLALRSAMEQLEGRLGRAIKTLRDELIAIVANAEASIDFSSEDIETNSEQELRERIAKLRDGMAGLHATADQGRILREGVRVVIYGRTNAGKSSLLNRLLGYERVIVSDAHGTTRDTVEETLNLQGVPVRLIDTAGLRNSADEIERKGIARTRKSLETADLSLHIVDGNAPPPPEFTETSANGFDLLVLNKSDLPEHFEWKQTAGLRISCMTGEGIESLQQQILGRISQENLRPESPFAVNARHRECLRRAMTACDRALQALAGQLSVEYVLVDLRDALTALGEILGTVDLEQILDSVFSQFCIGK